MSLLLGWSVGGDFGASNNDERVLDDRIREVEKKLEEQGAVLASLFAPESAVPPLDIVRAQKVFHSLLDERQVILEEQR